MNSEKIKSFAIKCLEEDNRYRSDPPTWEDLDEVKQRIYLDSAEDIMKFRRTKLIYRIAVIVTAIVFVCFFIVGG